MLSVLVEWVENGKAPGDLEVLEQKVQAPKKDAGLIRALAETLRGGAEKAEALRSTLAKAVMNPEMRTAFDIFGSELPDEVFAGVFDQPRQRGWRRVDL